MINSRIKSIDHRTLGIVDITPSMIQRVISLTLKINNFTVNFSSYENMDSSMVPEFR